MSLSRFLSRSLPVERLLDPDDPGAAGGGGDKGEVKIMWHKRQERDEDVFHNWSGGGRREDLPPEVREFFSGRRRNQVEEGEHLIHLLSQTRHHNQHKSIIGELVIGWYLKLHGFDMLDR